MTIPPKEVNPWQQLSMLPGGPSEITLRIGVFPEADHAQFQLELHAAGSRELLAMSARPHVDWSDRDVELEQWFDRVRAMLADLDRPFG
jgi:hypothetical protein